MTVRCGRVSGVVFLHHRLLKLYPTYCPWTLMDPRPMSTAAGALPSSSPSSPHSLTAMPSERLPSKHVKLGFTGNGT